MGYDVSYHPISEAEISEWYFDRLPEVRQENLFPARQLAQRFGVNDFYIDKYITTLRAGVTSQQNGDEPFDKTHGFYIAVVQGLFRDWFYIRGAALSFLIEEEADFLVYTKPWRDILQADISYPIADRITENYCSGVFLPYEQVTRLRNDYDSSPAAREKLDECFSHGRIDVFLKALDFCLENRLGLLEATEVAEPNPLDLNQSRSFSDFFNHCDRDGPILYREAALEQIAQMQKQVGNEKKSESKKGFFSKLFGK